MKRYLKERGVKTAWLRTLILQGMPFDNREDVDYSGPWQHRSNFKGPYAALGNATSDSQESTIRAFIFSRFLPDPCKSGFTKMIEVDKIPVWVSRGQKDELPYLCLKNLTEGMIEEIGHNPFVRGPFVGGSQPGAFQTEMPLIQPAWVEKKKTLFLM